MAASVNDKNTGFNESGQIKRSSRRGIANLISRIKGFIQRLFYIISIVWKASPSMLVAMSVLCALDGVLPVIGAYISSDLINEIASLLANGTVSSGNTMDNLFITMRPMMLLFAVQMVYLFLKRILGKINTCITAISGELVVNYIRVRIMDKAKTVDQRSFDDPAFYERL